MLLLTWYDTFGSWEKVAPAGAGGPRKFPAAPRTDARDGGLRDCAGRGELIRLPRPLDGLDPLISDLDETWMINGPAGCPPFPNLAPLLE
jgi:hypothetical protein